MSFIENPIYVLAVLCLMVILSVYAANTKFGEKFGAALLVIIFTAIVANLNLIPSASNSIDLYSGIFTYLAPISIFYLLLQVNLTSLKKAGAPMIILFLIGSLATTLGILVSWYIVSPQDTLGANASTIAGMLTGTYTGGSVNFNAVALEYDFQEKGILYAGTIAVDNVVTTIWIVITLAIPTLLRNFWVDKKVKVREHKSSLIDNDQLDMRSFMWLAFLGIAVYYVSELIAELFPSIPSILILSTIGILLAQTKFIKGLNGSHTLGLYLVYIFLAVIGSYCEISSVIQLQQVGITLLIFTSVAVLLHGLLTLLIGGLVYRDWEMIAIASQANVGGGTTAMALAETFNRKELILPAILVGTLGNAIGTYLGFLVIGIL
ncbi:DUF819 family protein [Fulvivirga sp.]|uniref:DUF819 family protein n=1 Tax=Fulvivirga sp. TaxID=1931237 RepID=UPI0032ED1677